MPRKTDRTHRISTCVNATELKILKAAADKAGGLPLSVYMRMAGLAMASDQKQH